MAIDDLRLSRRGVLLLGAALASGRAWPGASSAARAEALPARVPTRPFGATGVRVPILGLGGYFDPATRPDLLDLAVRRGVTLWEATLAKGAAGYGEYFRKHPDQRESIFLVGKARSSATEDLERDLARVLADAKTSYVDFFIVQGVSDPAFSTPELRRWVDAQKSAGRIRYFGFSTHANVDACLLRAPEVGGIDGIVAAHNYRLMSQAERQRALEGCARAGIALMAIKTQAKAGHPVAEIGDDTPDLRQRVEDLADGGFDLAQAKLRAVWSDPRIASLLSLMPEAKLLEANSAAARAPGRLSQRERRMLAQEDRATFASYCAGCASLCESRVEGSAPIGTVMRCMMYANGYRDLELARSEFAALPESTRRAIPSRDYSAAERACPRGIAIGKTMREASALLA